jgi:hypothetical protein
MSDEIALVDYVDGETGDSEHLEGFQKFCGEQDSEGGEEETPSTDQQYRVSLPAYEGWVISMPMKLGLPTYEKAHDWRP